MSAGASAPVHASITASTTAQQVDAASTDTGVIQGDVNCSGSVSVDDALALIEWEQGIGADASCAQSAGNVDCANGINVLDALWILRFAGGVPLATPLNCTAINSEIVSQPSSADLIDAAVTAGDIDAQTALVYKVFAAFGDNRLPPQYKGDDSNTPDSAAVDDATFGFDQLSPANQALVQPFLLPPAAPGSWLSLPTVAGAAEGTSSAQGAAAITWTSYTAVGGLVKVWAQDRYDGDAEKAQAIADAMTNKIWGKVTGYFGKTPIDDHGLPNNGGDNAFDIYLVHIGDSGQAQPYPGSGCKQYPVYLLLNSTRPLGSETSSGMLQDSVHELTHGVTNNFPLAAACKAPEYSWFSEATSMWAEDYVYPDAQSEHPFAHYLLDKTEVSLDSTANFHHYGAYLFAYYLTHSSVNASVVSIWQGFATRTSLAAVEQFLGPSGGFDENWPEFSNFNWNQPPVDYYVRLDKLNDRAIAVADPIKQGVGKYDINLNLPYLAATYRHFVIQDDAKSVVFKNTVAEEGIPHAHVWGIEKIDGAWKDPVDWTEKTRKDWCRDLPGQNIEELVLVFSNSDWQGKSTLKPEHAPTVEGKGTGCNNWWGTIRWTVDQTNGDTHSTTTSAADVLFSNDQPPGTTSCDVQGTQVPCETYYASGTVTYNSLQVTPYCTTTIGPATATIAHAEGSLIVYTDPDPQTYEGTGMSLVTGPSKTVCAGSPDQSSQWDDNDIWFSAPRGMFQVKQQGTVIEDTWVHGDVTYEWHLEPAS